MDNLGSIGNNADCDLVRKTIIADCELIVIKVGTRVLTHPSGEIDEERISQIANDICDLSDSGKRVVLVSSGAVGAGMSRLALKQRPADIARLQAIAAIGQAHLINVYNRTMQSRGYHAAQVLLTADDIEHRGRYLNVRNTLFSALEMGAIPIINENDTVAVDELVRKFGDNDHLAARVTHLLQAGLLIILSDIDGLYDGHPDDPNSKLIDTVTVIDERIETYVKDRANHLSRGGMASKIAAAKALTISGENMIIAKGNRSGTLHGIFQGKKIGTLFIAKDKSMTPRKRWLGYCLQPLGKIMLDDGAVSAIREQGRSLLPIGVTSVDGVFSSGDGVSLCNQSGGEIARGLTNYGAEDIRKILGLKSEKIAEVLGRASYAEVVHRNNMTVV